MKKLFYGIFLLLLTIKSQSQESAFSPAIQKSQKEFIDNKLGMFIHWGLYSILGNGEWIRNNRSIPTQEYD